VSSYDDCTFPYINAKPLTNPDARLFLIYQSKYWFPWYWYVLVAFSCFKYSRDFIHHLQCQEKIATNI